MSVRLLLSNDDGVDSPGILALAEAVEGLGEVWVVAPDRERSAQSHALTMHKPLRADPLRDRVFSVSGTPADCVYLGIHGLLPQRPALVLSGINRGSNLGTDVFYSGTVAAAMEAVLQGVPAVAFSLHGGKFTSENLATCRQVVLRVVEAALSIGLAPRTLWNVNIPPVSPTELRGLATAVLGVREYEDAVHPRQDPRGRPYFWIGGDHESFAPIPDSDGPLVERGYASVTPIRPDFTDHASLPSLRRWTDR